MSETFTFTVLDDGTESLVIVRAVPGGFGLTISKKSDGDVEVFLPLEDAERLALTIPKSLGHVRGPPRGGTRTAVPVPPLRRL